PFCARGFQMPIDLLVQIVPAVAIAGAASTLLTFLWERLRSTARLPEQALQDNLAKQLSALKHHSEQATSLLEALQGEVGKRTESVRTLQEELDALRQQRALLDFTTEQREAITAMVRRTLSVLL